MVTIKNDTLKHAKSQPPSETMYVSVIVSTKRFQEDISKIYPHNFSKAVDDKNWEMSPNNKKGDCFSHNFAIILI